MFKWIRRLFARAAAVLDAPPFMTAREVAAEVSRRSGRIRPAAEAGRRVISPSGEEVVVRNRPSAPRIDAVRCDPGRRYASGDWNVCRVDCEGGPFEFRRPASERPCVFMGDLRKFLRGVPELTLDRSCDPAVLEQIRDWAGGFIEHGPSSRFELTHRDGQDFLVETCPDGTEVVFRVGD